MDTLRCFLETLWPAGVPDRRGPTSSTWCWARQCHQFMLAHLTLWLLDRSDTAREDWAAFDPPRARGIPKHPSLTDTGLLRRFLGGQPDNALDGCPLLHLADWPAHDFDPVDGVTDLNEPLGYPEFPPILLDLPALPAPAPPPLAQRAVHALVAGPEAAPTRSRTGHNIFQAYVNHVRLLDPIYEAAWERFVSGCGGQRHGPPLDPRSYPTDTLGTFLGGMYGPLIPTSGIPLRHTWDGRRAALAQRVQRLFRQVGHREAWERFANLVSPAISLDPHRVRHQDLLLFLEQQDVREIHQLEPLGYPLPQRGVAPAPGPQTPEQRHAAQAPGPRTLTRMAPRPTSKGANKIPLATRGSSSGPRHRGHSPATGGPGRTTDPLSAGPHPSGGTTWLLPPPTRERPPAPPIPAPHDDAVDVDAPTRSLPPDDSASPSCDEVAKEAPADPESPAVPSQHDDADFDPIHHGSPTSPTDDAGQPSDWATQAPPQAPLPSGSHGAPSTATVSLVPDEDAAAAVHHAHNSSLDDDEEGRVAKQPRRETPVPQQATWDNYRPPPREWSDASRADEEAEWGKRPPRAAPPHRHHDWRQHQEEPSRGTSSWERPPRDQTDAQWRHPQPQQLYREPIDDLDFRPVWARGAWESFGQAVQRLQRTAGRTFVTGWHAVCDHKAGGSGKGSYNPLNDESLARTFLDELRWYGGDIRRLCQARGLQINWEGEMHTQERSNQERHDALMLARGKGKQQPPKGYGKQPASRQRPSSANQRTRPYSRGW